MTNVVDAQGQIKEYPYTLARGTIILFYGSRAPEGWALCDGNNGTPDLRDRVVLGDTVAGTGTAGGTASPATGFTHSGFNQTDHAAHVVTQPSTHGAHSVTQPSAHSAHSPTQPTDHGTHSSDGAHTHNDHTFVATGPAVLGAVQFAINGPVTHSSDGAHAHNAHPAHTGFNVNAHSAHAGLAVDAHAAHSGMTVDAHSPHSETQADTHVFKHYILGYVMKL